MNGRAKRMQGRRETRIKPTVHIPPYPTRHHRRVDTMLSLHEKMLADTERKAAEAERKAAERAEQLERERINAETKAARRATQPQQQKHRHKYKKLLRVTEQGNRVVACNCGDYILSPLPDCG